MAGLTKKLLEKLEKSPPAKVTRYYDADGLYAQISPRGVISFAMKYRHGKKERRDGLGRWPAVSLDEARRKARQVRVSLDRGERPLPDTFIGTFADGVAEWKKVNTPAMAPRTKTQVERYLAECVKGFGEKKLAEVTPGDVLAVLRKIEARGRFETARRTRMYCAAVFDVAMATGACTSNPAAPLKAKGVMAKRPPVQHFHAMPSSDIPAFLEKLAWSNHHPSVRAALRFLVLTAMRTNEVIGLEWGDVAAGGASLTIPADRMKAGRSHTVILSAQARATLEAIREFSNGRTYVFPGQNPRDPLSNMALLSALKKLAPGNTVHGFRSSFSTWAHASAAAPHVVERCLAHARQDKVAAAYNRHTYDAEAAKLWQAWADEMIPAATSKQTGRGIKSKAGR